MKTLLSGVIAEILFTGHFVDFSIKVHLISQQGFFPVKAKKSQTSEQREKRIEENRFFLLFFFKSHTSGPIIMFNMLAFYRFGAGFIHCCAILVVLWGYFCENRYEKRFMHFPGFSFCIFAPSLSTFESHIKLHSLCIVCLWARWLIARMRIREAVYLLWSCRHVRTGGGIFFFLCAFTGI